MRNLNPTSFRKQLAQVTDAQRLFLLEQFCGGRVNQAINRRMAIQSELDAHAVNGMVDVFESGMDCDGVRYGHYKETIPASLSEYWKVYERTARWADGPFSLTIYSPGTCPEGYSEGHGWGII